MSSRILKFKIRPTHLYLIFDVYDINQRSFCRSQKQSNSYPAPVFLCISSANYELKIIVRLRAE